MITFGFVLSFILTGRELKIKSQKYQEYSYFLFNYLHVNNLYGKYF